METHDGLRRFYRQAEDEGAREHPRSAVLVARETAKLMLHVHKTIDILYDRRAIELTGEEMIRCYKAYMEWEAELPDNMAPPPGIAETEQLEHLAAPILTLQ